MAYKVSKGKNKIRGEQTFVDTISGSVISASYFVGNGTLLSNVTSATSSYSATASYALNSNLLDNRDSTTFAGTGSNTFIGNQIISGSQDYILEIHQTNDAPWALAIYNDSASQTQPSLGAFVWNDGRAAFGTEIDTPLQIYTNQGYYDPTLIVSSSGVTINNSLSVSSGITGSLFGTASYASNANLLDGRDSITFAGTGSNIFIGDQTITGNVNISGIVTANELHITYTTSSVIYTSGSTKFGDSADDTHQFTGSIFAGIISGTTGQLTNLSSSYISASHIDLGQYIDFYTAGTNPAYQQGRLYYNVDTQDPAFYTDVAGVGINIGQQTAVKVKNSSGVSISKGKLVHIIGGAGANPLIATASWENDNNSANTLGMAMNTMNQNDFGYVLLNGVIEGVNTQGFTAGEIIYLSSSGDYTNSKPQAPLHAVKIGEVIRVQQNNGAIFVNINNGQEINELHDVRITSASVGDLLTYSSYSGSNVWVNTKTLSGSYVITGSLTISSSATFTNIGPAIFSGTINTNNIISGTTAQFTQITASAISSSNYIGSGQISSSATSIVGGYLSRTIFGDASDGSAVLDATASVAWATLAGVVYTMTRDCYTENLTINSGVTLRTANWLPYARGTLTNNGTIETVGNDASGGTAGATVAAAGTWNSTGGAGGAGVSINSTGSIGLGSGGNSLGGGGGSGGTSGVNAGGTGNTSAAISTILSNHRTINFLYLRRAIGNVSINGSGGGGAGGAGNISGGSTATSGGGGSGAPTCGVACNILINNGTIRSKGGNGGNAVSAGTASAGGGGGGSGGFVYVVANILQVSGTITSSGGTGGAGSGSGAASGSAGTGGTIIILTGSTN